MQWTVSQVTFCDIHAVCFSSIQPVPWLCCLLNGSGNKPDSNVYVIQCKMYFVNHILESADLVSAT